MVVVWAAVRGATNRRSFMVAFVFVCRAKTRVGHLWTFGSLGAGIGF